MRTFKLELRVDYDDPERDAIMRQGIREAAQALLTTANMIADNRRKPEIAIWSGDFFEPMTELDLLQDEEEVSTPGGNDA